MRGVEHSFTYVVERLVLLIGLLIRPEPTLPGISAAEGNQDQLGGKV